MSRVEKLLSVVVGLIALGGTIAGALGQGAIAVSALLIVGIFVTFLVAQVLREARSQKRSTELLKESMRMAREAIAETRQEGVHARNDIVGQCRRIRDSMQDQFRRSYRRDISLSSDVASMLEELQSEIEGARHATQELLGTTSDSIVANFGRESRSTRATVRSFADTHELQLGEAVTSILAQVDARSRQVRNQTVSERNNVIAELVKSESGIRNTIVSNGGDVGRVQHILSQKAISQQDGLRRVVGAMGSALEANQKELEVLREDLQRVEHTLDGMVGNPALADLVSSVSEQGQALADLRGQFATLNEQFTKAVAPLLIGGRGELQEDSRSPGSSKPDSDGSLGVVGNEDEMAEADSQRSVEAAIAAQRDALERTWRALELVHSFEDLPVERREEMLGRLYSELGMQNVRQEHILDVNKFDIGVSFRSMMVRLLLLKHRLVEHGYDISPRENDKLRDRDFARLVGVPTPKTIARDVTTEELPLTPGTVVKPTVGESANGVFYIRPDGEFVSIKTRKTYSGLGDAVRECERLVDPEAPIRWIAEEAVLGEDGWPARDLKAFMFYGRAGMYREITRGKPGKGGNQVVTYDELGSHMVYRSGDSLVAGDGIPEGVAEMARKISLESPVPFLRVDFLVGVNGPVLGEITPHPGGIYVGSADDKVDRKLGELFLDAEARLTIDLLHGKKFKSYFDAYRPIDKVSE